jgi:hypothetical protein
MRDSNVSLFGLKLSEIERHFLGNVKKTKSVFPDETTAIERGLVLMLDLTADLNGAVRKNKDQIHERKRKYRQTHKEHIKQHDKQRYREHRNQILTKTKTSYHKQHPNAKYRITKTIKQQQTPNPPHDIAG